MFWKKKEKFDRIQAYLDKVGLADGAEKPLDGIIPETWDMFSLCVKEGDSELVIAQMSGNEEECIFFCDPTTQQQRDKIREICIETGIRYSVEKDVDCDLPEEERLPQKWSITIPVKHWKKLTCLLMRELFGAEDFDALPFPMD